MNRGVLIGQTVSLRITRTIYRNVDKGWQRGSTIEQESLYSSLSIEDATKCLPSEQIQKQECAVALVSKLRLV